jgi:hypothetical protein
MTMTESEVRIAKWQEEREERDKKLDDAANSLKQEQREAITKVWNLLDDMETHIRECFDLDMQHVRRLSTLEWKMRGAFPELCKGVCTCDD